ncbi:MAG: cell division protease FtsH, partial [Flavobacterium sp.]
MGKNLLLWLIIAAVLLTVFRNFDVTQATPELDYSTFLELVNRGQIKTVDIDGLIIRGTKFDGESFETVQPQVAD